MIETFPPFEAVVLAAGDYPVHPLPVRLLREATYVVCCDGAANAYLERGGKPNAIVGDGDSFIAQPLDADCRRVVLPEQDTNDLTKSISFLHEQGVRRVAILGATGGREDHTLGNISLLIEYLRLGMTMRMITDHGIFIPARGRQTFSGNEGQQVSVFICAERVCSGKPLRYEGLRYPAPARLANWWQGTLNECTGNEFTIDTDEDYLVYLPHR